MKKNISTPRLRSGNGSQFNSEQLDGKKLLAALTAFKRGDFSARLPDDWTGIAGKVADIFNDTILINQRLTQELERIRRVVGKEGRIRQRASLGEVSGSWAEAVSSVNDLIGDLVHPTSEMARVIGAVAKGNLSETMATEIQGRELEGEFLRTAKIANTMVRQLNAFASEVTRVAREVGIEGKLGGQANVKGVAGTWKDLTENVNLMAGNLTDQVRNIATVTTAVATGDLTKKITVDVKGEFLELKDTINVMVDQLRSFASEVTRVAREVGSEGILGGQARVEGVSGTWKDLTDSVNFMARNLTEQVRNIAAVTTAVAKGDLSKKITVNVKGEILELKNITNTMVDQLSSFASEVTRVAREVGTDGKLGGQADVRGVAGTWKDLTESVNSMAGNLTAQVRNIAEVTTAVASGDLSKKITVDVRGEILELKYTINTMVDQLRSFASEVTRVAREVGSEGKLGGQADVQGVAGTWKDLTNNVNTMAGNLTAQVRNIAEVTTAVARGDLSKKVTVDVKGEILELKNTVNTMVDQLNSFASEVTRVAREVGTEGELGGQATVMGVAGTWKDLTDSVNFMARNLTNQVRGIAKVVTAVAEGELNQKLLVEAKGEIGELADTINDMIDTLATFADQVTTVAREVGVEGKLGGQANVPGAAGTWRDLTDNVNRLAANLTTQLRAIADVATAVTKGDLTRSIQVGAQGEVAAVKDNINEMIRNLKDTTLRNKEQDWLKTNLAKFTRMLQGQRDLLTVSKLTLSELAPVVPAQQGVFYIMNTSGREPELKLIASYACEGSGMKSSFKLGESLVGQAALEKKRILITEAPSDYIKVSSALGAARPMNIVVLPILFEGEIKGVMELSSLEHFNSTHHAFLDQLAESIGIVLHTIEANTRTENLLKQSQSLATELQNRQEELQKTNLELAEKARSNLAKDQFLAMLSHELRTPLTPVLASALALESEPALPDGVHESLQMIRRNVELEARLIDDLLDLTRIDRGKVQLNFDVVDAHILLQNALEICQPEIDRKHLVHSENLGARKVYLRADPARLQQIFWNLINNAVKFTPNEGQIFLSTSNDSEGNLKIEIADSGLGIEPEALPKIFDAFEQGGRTQLGGLGLGLAISKALVEAQDGTITAESAGRNMGSKFTLVFPTSALAASQLAPAVSARTSDRHGIRILLVEDHEDTNRSLTNLLRRRGYHVESAFTLQSALNVSSKGQFDVLISDLALPDGSGIDLVQILRSTRPIVGIALTGFGREDDIREGREAGFHHHLVKPIDLNRLDSLIQESIKFGLSS